MADKKDVCPTIFYLRKFESYAAAGVAGDLLRVKTRTQFRPECLAAYRAKSAALIRWAGSLPGGPSARMSRRRCWRALIFTPAPVKTGLAAIAANVFGDGRRGGSARRRGGSRQFPRRRRRGQILFASRLTRAETTCKTLSPAGCPCSSLTTLNRSISTIRREKHAPHFCHVGKLSFNCALKPGRQSRSGHRCLPAA